jgi:hypothetical protein
MMPYRLNSAPYRAQSTLWYLLGDLVGDPVGDSFECSVSSTSGAQVLLYTPSSNFSCLYVTQYHINLHIRRVN